MITICYFFEKLQNIRLKSNDIFRYFLRVYSLEIRDEGNSEHILQTGVQFTKLNLQEFHLIPMIKRD